MIDPRRKRKIILLGLLLGTLMLGMLAVLTSPPRVDATTMCCSKCVSGQPAEGCSCSGQEDQFDKCPGKTGCGCCDGGCGGPPPCQTQNPSPAILVSPANGATNLTTPITFVWQAGSSWGNGCPNSGLQFRLRYKVKPAGGCASTAIPWSTSSPNIPSNITTVTRNGFNYDTTYCWMITKVNNGQTRNSAMREFTTAKRPVIVSSGFQNVNQCGGAQISGRTEHAPNVNNPVTYVIEVRDAESNFTGGINRFDHARVVFVPTQTQSAPTVDYQILHNAIPLSSGAGFGVNLSNLQAPQFFASDNAAALSGSGDLSNSSGTASLLSLNGSGRATRIERVNDQTLRIYWEVRFNNSFATAALNAYVSVALNVNGTVITQDADGVTGELRKYQKRNTWAADLQNPVTKPRDPEATGTNTFEIDWRFDDTDYTPGPGTPRAGSVRTYCYTTGDPITIVDITNPANPITINLVDRSDNPPAFPEASNCFADSLGIRRYRVNDLSSLADIRFAMTAQDNACNRSTDSILYTSPTPWIITYNSDASAAEGFNGFRPRDVDLKDVVGTLGNDDAYLSTYAAIVGNNAMVPSRESRSDFYATNYEDLGLQPPVIAGGQSWYTFLRELAGNSAAIEPTDARSLEGNFSSDLGVSANAFVFFQVDGDLKVEEDSRCNIRGVFFVAGNLTIDPSLRRSSTGGCVFIVSGNITIGAGSRSNLTTAFTETAKYDVVEAFLITDGNMTIANDSFGPNEVPDGLRVVGGVFTGGTQVINRGFGVSHNRIQPSVTFEYDPRYVDIFRDIFAVRVFSIRPE